MKQLETITPNEIAKILRIHPGKPSTLAVNLRSYFIEIQVSANLFITLFNTDSYNITLI
jgi:hypothetical protein